jgi:hypothetical protein
MMGIIRLDEHMLASLPDLLQLSYTGYHPGLLEAEGIGLKTVSTHAMAGADLPQSG